MSTNETKLWLQFFQDVSSIYRDMYMYPLWESFPDHETNRIHSLSIFLGMYAFERQGRNPNYFHVAVDSLKMFCGNNPIDAEKLWTEFSKWFIAKNKDQTTDKLNKKNNPLFFEDDYSRKPDSQKSLIEILPEQTLSNYLSGLIIKEMDVKAAYGYLLKIRGIGPKISSFYLRDLVDIYGINLNEVNNRELLQPIDIWVERTIWTLSQKKDQKKEVAKWIVDNSFSKLNPEYINMGIWFFGAVIAGSEYRLENSLKDPTYANVLLRDYLIRIKRVCTSDIMKKVEEKL